MSTPSSGPSPNYADHHAAGNNKAHRVLACVLCQQRKIRCDRTFPCANCKKQDVRCVPATQTRPRRKRFPERELLDRLRRYEALLRDNKVKFDPLHKQDYPDGEIPGDEDGHARDDYADEHVKHETASPSGSLKSENVTEARSIWQAISQESPSNPGKDTPIANAMENNVKSAWDQLADGDSTLLGMNHSPVDLSTFHPDPVSAFKLWQIYLDFVDPIMKVTHTPSLQPRFITAIGNTGAIKPALEALIFGIYASAILAIPEEEAKEVFGLDWDDMLTKYQFGCQQALMNAGYLRSSDRDCITALLLYLQSLRPGTNPRAITAMSAMAVRLSECLGIHRESSHAKCTPFEAEMRRRLWWALALYDSRMSEKADHKDSTLNPTWDCRTPVNCNDSDLWPDMKEPPTPSKGATEATFIVLRSELADHMRNSQWHLDFTNPHLKPLARELPGGGDLQALYRRVNQDYLRHCNADNRLHFFILNFTNSYLQRAQLFEHFAGILNRRDGQPLSEADSDKGLQLALDYLDCDTLLIGSPHCRGYLWYLQSYFPFPAYMHTIQDMRRRPLGQLVGRAWEVMHANYQARFRAYFHYLRTRGTIMTPMFIMFSRTVLAAWDAQQKASLDPSKLQTPKIVTEILARQMAETPIDPSSGAPVYAEQQTAIPKGLSSFAGGTTAPDPNATMTFENGQDSFMMSLDMMPYPSMVAQDSFTYDPSQFEWFMPQS